MHQREREREGERETTTRDEALDVSAAYCLIRLVAYTIEEAVGER